MNALAGVLRDDKACKGLEADFRQYYGLDIREIWSEHKPNRLCFFTAARLMVQLPAESRTYRNASQDMLTYDQHLAMTQIDALRRIEYFTAVAATVHIPKPTDRRSIVSHAPQPLPRSDDEAQRQKKKVISVRPQDAGVAVTRLMSRMAIAKSMG